MKLAIIAAAILSSSAAFAGNFNTNNTGHLYFGATQEASCGIRVVTDNAPIFFEYNDSANMDNYAQVDIRSDFAKKLLITSNGEWTTTEAWGGRKPTTTIHVMTEGSIGNSGDTLVDTIHYEKLFEMNGEASQESSFFMGVQAEDMTNAGHARMDAVVQFECE